MIGMKRVCAAGVRRACAQVPSSRFAAATVPVPHQAWFHAHTSVVPAAAQHAASTWMSRASGMHSASARATFCTSSGEQAKEASEDEAAAGDAATGEQTEQEASQAEPTVEERLAQCEEEVKELAATRLRLLAEMENVRSIARNDVERAKKFAAKSFAKSLLSIADNLERAMACVPADARSESGDPLLRNLFEGVQMTEEIMLKVFSQHGITQFGKQGDEFDPNVHNALFQRPDPELGPGVVAEVLKVGFMYHDMVLRPAEVGTTPDE